MRHFHFALSGIVLSSLLAHAQTITLSSVVNAASTVAGPVAPGELVNLMGTNLAEDPLKQCAAVAGVLPTLCSGVTLLVNDKPAPLLFTSSGQIGFQIPPDVAGPTATVQVTRDGIASSLLRLTVAPVAPGLLTQSGVPSGTGVFLNAANQTVSSTNPAHPGDVVTAFGVGFGATSPAVPAGALPSSQPASFVIPPTVAVGGKDAQVVAAVLSTSMVGVAQITFKVPLDAPTGDILLVATAGTVKSQNVTIPLAISNRPAISTVLNNATGLGAISSGSWVSIYGINLSATTRRWKDSDFAGNNLPTALDGVSVKINSKSAAVYYVSPEQLNVQAPTDIGSGTVQVEVTNSSGVVTDSATVQTYAPGFFPVAGKYPAAVHTDRYYVAPVGVLGAAVASRPARPGETILLYGTGFGPTAPAVPAGVIVSSPAPLADLTQLRITIGGVPARVDFAGLVAAGEYQINVVVPEVPDGDQPITASIAGVSTPAGLVVPVLH